MLDLRRSPSGPFRDGTVVRIEEVLMTTPDPADAAWTAWHDEEAPIRVGVSSCLLGAKVRYDGGHKRDRYLTDVIGDWVQWVPVCPEVEVGMPTPRPTIRLEGSEEVVRLVEPKSREDWTERMEQWSDGRIDGLMEAQLDGYVLKRASPSCGMERVKVWSGAGMPAKSGVGVFARVLMDRWPNLPVEEEGRLNDPVLRENFIVRIFCRHRWRRLLRDGGRRADLVAYHTAHKMLLQSHTEAGYRRLGRLVASLGTRPDEEVLREYEDELFSTLRNRATIKRHTNVLQHAAGYLKRVLDPASKAELRALIEDYRQGFVPLVVPITLLRHHVHRHGIDYMAGQLYLEPHPKELMLRNRV
jgi:uncharacterized protein YbgA (DUF1722 family)/uncharacterized protein YbbK (DUF523 family)